MSLLLLLYGVSEGEGGGTPEPEPEPEPTPTPGAVIGGGPEKKKRGRYLAPRFPNPLMDDEEWLIIK